MKVKRASKATGTRTRNAPSRATRAPAAAQRADSRICQEICERLSRPGEDVEMTELTNEQLDVSDVTVTVTDGKVTLEGTVPERRMKPYIEALVDVCPGVQDIDNRLRVRR